MWHPRQTSLYVRTHLNWKYISTAQMAKNLRMALCCKNQEYRGTSRHYGLHSSVHSTSITVLGLLKKEAEEEEKELVHNGAVFRLAT